MKRSLSILLTFALILTMVSTFFISNVSAVTIISNTSPAITANVGETISLSGYSVIFDGDTTATNSITWKDSSSNTITSYKPTEKGVTSLTATSGDKSKTIYVVAKNASDTEYVLFEADMTAFKSVADLNDAGWTTPYPANSANYSFDANGVNLINTNDAYTAYQLLLPQWLGDFGDYSFSADVKMVSSVDTSRWMGLTYRNAGSGWAPPFLQMCVRDNTTAANGIELSERSKLTSGSDWTLLKTASASIASLKTAYHTFNVQAFDRNVRYNIDGKQVLYANLDNNDKKLVNNPLKGMLGFTAAGCAISIKNVKVTIQETTPIDAPAKTSLIDNAHTDLNLLNPIANVQYVPKNSVSSVLGSNSAPGSIMLNVSEVSDLVSVLSSCDNKSILPTFTVASVLEADKLLNAMSETGFIDANVISANADVLSYIRSKNTTIRTGLIVSIASSKTALTAEEANEIRLSARKTGATFCVIDVAAATRETVSAIQNLAVAVWVDMTSSANFAVDAVKAVTSGANGVISTSEKNLATNVNKYLGENAMTRTPVIIGHRGNPTQATPNSLNGCITAYNNGADVLEIDLWYTKDGKIIVNHDSTLNATTNYTGSLKVSEMTYAEICNYRLKDQNGNLTNEVISLFSDILEEFQGKDIRIFVEFKGGTLEQAESALNMIKTYGMTNQVCIIAFGTNYLVQSQQTIPGMSTGYLFSDNLPTSVNSANEALTELYKALNTVLSINSTINPSYGLVRPNKVVGHPVASFFTQAATDRGMTVWPWTFKAGNDRITGTNALDLGFFSGCDGVTTDDAQWYKDMIKFIEAENFSLNVGESFSSGAGYVESYGNKKTTLSKSNAKIIVLDGAEYLTVSNGNITGKSTGTATVMFSYTTKTTAGTEYVLYSQPVTVTIKSSGAVETPKYTTTTPNYNCTDTSDVDRFKDDGKRLTDGIKSTANVNSNAYSVWKVPGSVAEIVLNLGEKQSTNVYTVYAAGNFWGVSAPSKVTIYGSNDGSIFTEIGSSTKVVTLGNGIKVDAEQSELYSITVTTEATNNYQYIKFSIAPGNAHVWIDEIEVSLTNAQKFKTIGLPK